MQAIPCMLMRAGTSKGPFFLASDLPADPAARDRLLLAVMGSPDSRQIDGLGGATTLTSKVAIVGRSALPGVDVDYLFAQVCVAEARVDTTPNCGNMLSGVAPFAIESGLVRATHPVTTVRIYNVNTGKLVDATVQTPDGAMCYAGDTAIDGVPGTAAPIILDFLNAEGTRTGALLPTGRAVDMIEEVAVTCIDFSIPVVMLAAAAVGKSGYESKAELDADRTLLERLERIRRQAAILMGLGDVSASVVPKIVLLAAPRNGGTVCSRYFVPSSCHAAHAVTGALCVGAACLTQGTVATGVAALPQRSREIVVEHPAGRIEVLVRQDSDATTRRIVSAGVVRTARPLFRGEVLVMDADSAQSGQTRLAA